MNDDFPKRLEDVIYALRIENQEFAQAGGVGKATLSGYMTTGRRPNSDTLANWVLKFNINANWLLTGQGEMFSPPTTQAAQLNPPEDQISSREKVLDKYVELYGPDKGIEMARLVLGE